MKKIISIIFVVLIFLGCFPSATISAKSKTTTKRTTVSSTVKATTSKSTAKKTTTTTTTTTVAAVKVAVPKSVVVSENLSSVTVSWNRNKKAQGYIVSRSKDKEKWSDYTTIKGNKNNFFTDTKIGEDTLYYYSVKAYKTKNGTNYYSAPSVSLPVFHGINLYASSYENSVVLNWQRVEDVKGYEVYFSENNKKFKRIKRIAKNENNTYTITELMPFEKKYFFYIKVYNKINGKRNYIYKSNVVDSSDISAIINGSIGEPKKTFKTTNVQGKKAYRYSRTKISDADKNTFASFEASFLTKDMSPHHKIYNVFMFIHKKITYASGSLWSQIGNSTYVDAIFNKRIGQCAQYNGAMVSYLANYGINAKLIMGYRGTSRSKWQHFWGEAKLANGKTYVIETGNYGNDGNWYYYFKEYKDTKKYLKCGKYVSGIKA